MIRHLRREGQQGRRKTRKAKNKGTTWIRTPGVTTDVEKNSFLGMRGLEARLGQVKENRAGEWGKR